MLSISSAQIDPAKIGEVLQITGVGGQSDVIEITMSGLGNVNLNSWTFNNWSPLSGAFDAGVEDVIIVGDNDNANDCWGAGPALAC